MSDLTLSEGSLHFEIFQDMEFVRTKLSPIVLYTFRVKQSCKKEIYIQFSDKINIPQDSIACKTTYSNKLKIMTLSVCHIVVEEFFPSLLYNIASVH